MAIKLEPGELTVHLHYGKDLKDADWFGEQDPYVILKCGKTKYRSNTHHAGGRNPVWNQPFVFKIDQETKVELEVRDEDLIKDDWIGRGAVDIVSVRQEPGRRHELQVHLFRRLSNRQQGVVSLTVSFRPAAAAAAPTTLQPAPSSGLGVTLAAHEREAAVAAAAAATVAAENSAARRGVLGLAPSAHRPAPGSSLPAGLVAPGSLPDTVPSYTPTCGLIEPQPHQMLPCHQGRVNGGSTAAQAAGPSAPPAPFAGPLPGGAAPQPPAASGPNYSYDAVHSQHFNVSGSFSSAGSVPPPPPGAPPAPFAGAPPADASAHAYSHMYQQPPPPQYAPTTYSHDPYAAMAASGYGSSVYGAPPSPAGYPPQPGPPPRYYGPAYGAPPPYGAPAASYPPPQPPPAYGMPPPPQQPGGYHPPPSGSAMHG